jgi:diguanylate cyclase (GGDEF)-like protein/excisionase family DNA binding protein
LEVLVRGGSVGPQPLTDSYPRGTVIRSQPSEPPTVSVAKAARYLGVHPNTIRTWTEMGRLACLRINARGDRRYRLTDLDAFIADATRAGEPRWAARTDRPALRLVHDVERGRAEAAEARSDLEDVSHRLELAEALQRIARDLSGKLDLSVVLGDLVDHAMALFVADRGAVYVFRPDGTAEPAAARKLSERFLAYVRDVPSPSLPALTIAQRRPLYSVGYADDPRGAGVRAAVIQEGFDTIGVAPLLTDDETLGVLALYHDEPHEWSEVDLQTLGALAAQASMAIRNARDYDRMASWTAQLQSIQQLGTRLSRLATVREIGMAIAAELHELIEYHNVRVYRVRDNDVEPVAWRGHIGEYTDEDSEKLRVAVGQGITGWVAEHGVAQYLPDAARDPRAKTIPGTEDDLPESMLLAPMTFDDRVLGVIVLSKLGVDQFSQDDLRLLEIYASFAAHAVLNAEARETLNAYSERLERQLRGQRELLRITESILTALDPATVVSEIADRLGALISVDSLALFLLDDDGEQLRPLIARGIHADLYMGRQLPLDGSLAGWVVRHGQAQLVPDQRVDPRVLHFEEVGPAPGTLIAAPLRGPDGIIGGVVLERLGEDARFTDDEFELVQLFAGHVAIAMRNAELHQAVEILAQTDELTGVGNYRTFHADLERAVTRGEQFGLLMLDLDDFKSYNDSLGHQAGDALLQGIARALQAAGRGSDRVYRYGGDEFALILPNADSDGSGAVAVAEKARRAVRAVSGVGRRGAGRPTVTCSIGVAAFPTDGSDAKQILLAADRACYVAKRTGRDRIATAIEGLALAAEFALSAPTPVDQPTTVLAEASEPTVVAEPRPVHRRPRPRSRPTSV